MALRPAGAGHIDCRQPVKVGGASGWIDSQDGMVDLSWTQAGTSARVQGQGITTEQALQIATSMR